MRKKIKFNPVDQLSEYTVNPPKPASEYIPDWYKSATPFYTKKPEFNPANGKPNATFKLCMPFLDSFHMGYIQETWCDIVIEKKEDKTLFYYASGPKIMSERSEHVSNSYPKIDGYLTNHFTWHPPWFPELPPGYSCIITHPFNHDLLPFKTLAGVVDADGFKQSEAGSNLPFLLQENFSGLIKKGTPMYQIIPFKRESWQSEASEHDEKNQLKITMAIKQFMYGGYKKLFWNKKSFD
jgi:hypothetical protein